MPTAAYRFLAYYGALACFAILALGFNLVAWIRHPPGPGPRVEGRTRLSIHRFFRSLLRALALARLVDVEYRGFEPEPPHGRVLVANHPGLLDAVYLLALAPDAICIFKPSVRFNPLFGPAANRAGYLASDRRHALVRSAVEKVRAGATLVVFPEGTRTPASGVIGPFKPGFAVIARHAAVPVQAVRITAPPRFFTKETRYWKVPPLPARVVVEAGPCFDLAEARSLDALVMEVESWFSDCRAAQARPAIEAWPATVSSSTLTAT